MPQEPERWATARSSFRQSSAPFAFAPERPTKRLYKPSPASLATRRETMGSGTNARQRLVSFVTALLGTALLCLAFGDIALAEDAAPPVCGGKVLEKCTPNSGDTAWMLASVALVLMMTIPGLGLFCGGMVRKKNVGDTVMTSFAVTCLVTILFALVTYSMAFRAGTPFVGGLDRVFLKDILSDIGKGGIGNPNPLAATIPESVYICFQMTFAIITPALLAGAFAERMKFSAMLWVGWFGFNAGSAVTAGMQAGMAMLVTQIATAVAAFTWMVVEWTLRGKPTVVGICSGAVAGLVAITPASGFVGPIGAFAIGIGAGVFCYWGCTGLKRMFGYDDALDCFGIHAIGGIVGALLTGVFAVEQYGRTAGVLEGNVGQIFHQSLGVAPRFRLYCRPHLNILLPVEMFVAHPVNRN